MTRHTTTCDLGPWPNRGLSASIPTVAGCKAFLKEKVLCCGTGSLVQGTKVPKDPGIAQPIAVEVLRGNVCHDPQMEPSRIWMISGHRISRPTAAVTPPNNTKATKPRHTSVQISDKKIIDIQPVFVLVSLPVLLCLFVQFSQCYVSGTLQTLHASAQMIDTTHIHESESRTMSGPIS